MLGVTHVIESQIITKDDFCSASLFVWLILDLKYKILEGVGCCDRSTRTRAARIKIIIKPYVI